MRYVTHRWTISAQNCQLRVKATWKAKGRQAVQLLGHWPVESPGCEHVFILQEKGRNDSVAQRPGDYWGQLGHTATRTTFLQIYIYCLLSAEIGNRKHFVFSLLLATHTDLKSWVILLLCLYSINSHEHWNFKLVPHKTGPRTKWLLTSLFFFFVKTKPCTNITHPSQIEFFSVSSSGMGGCFCSF